MASTRVVLFAWTIILCYLSFYEFRSSPHNLPDPLYLPTETDRAVATATVEGYSGSASPTQTIKVVKEPEKEKHAYVFYATDPNYACSALVNAMRIRRYSSKPIYLLVPKGIRDTIKGPRMAALFLEFEANDVTVIEEDVPQLAAGGAGYYASVLLKLRAFRMHQIVPGLERVVAMDSDQLILKSLDHLFHLPETDIAAPRAYWIGKDALTTTLLMINLSEDLWERMNAEIVDIESDEYDMDLINRHFWEGCMMLPARYCTLNSHWEGLDIPRWMSGAGERPAPVNETDAMKVQRLDEPLRALYEDEAEVVHFTAMGKPWQHSHVLDVNWQREDRTVHPLLLEQFRTWWREAGAICGAQFQPDIPT